VTESQSFREFAQKWRNLVELRRAYFIALQKTGRWKQYYSEAEFPVVMREAVALAETWSKTTASCHPLRPIRGKSAEPHSRVSSTVLEHFGAQSRKVADISDKIIRPNKCLERNHDSI
jgi:hypothetical protein